MKQVLKTVYELDEVKQKAIEKNRYINVDFDDWCDFIIEKWEDVLDKVGFEQPKIKYSGFCSQGDGACFEATPCLEKLIKQSQQSEKNKEILLDNINNMEASITCCNHHYCHANTMDFDIYFYGDDEETQKIVDDFTKEIEELRYNLSNDIYKELYDEFYNQISDEAVEETLRANDYDFEEDGTIYSD